MVRNNQLDRPKTDGPKQSNQSETKETGPRRIGPKQSDRIEIIRYRKWIEFEYFSLHN